MKKSEIDNILANDLGRELSPEGFTYTKATKWLVRNKNDVSQIVSWSYYSAGKGFVVVPAIGVRSEAILALFKQVTPIRKEDEKFRRTLSADLWRLSGDRSRGEFKVTTDDDARRAAAAIAVLVRSDGLPFFAQCASISDIDRVFNMAPNSPGARLFSLDNWTRTANALIAARLAHDPNYEGLIDAYRTSLAGFADGHYLKQYESLVVLLSKVE